MCHKIYDRRNHAGLLYMQDIGFGKLGTHTFIVVKGFCCSKRSYVKESEGEGTKTNFMVSNFMCTQL